MDIHDKLDAVPQVPSDYANHIIYGGGFSIFLALILGHWLPAMYVVLAIAGAKKVFDYFNEHESVRTCLQKTVVTAALPILFVILPLPGVCS